MTPLIAAIPTPFAADGSMQLDNVAEALQQLQSQGVTGAFVGGTTGEFSALTQKEREALLESAVANKGELRIFAHVGDLSTATACELAAHAEDLHVDAIAAAIPSWFPFADADAVARHCGTISAVATNTPFFYYHIPHLSGPGPAIGDIVRTLRDSVPQLAGVKFTDKDLHSFLCCQQEHPNLEWLFGVDELHLPSLSCAPDGFVGSTYNIIAPLYLKLQKRVAEHDQIRARQLQIAICQFIQTLIGTGNFLACLKYILSHQGIVMGSTRLPLPDITAAEQAVAIEAYEQVLQVS